MSRHWLLVLSCIAFGLLCPIHASVSYPPPGAWKAINYYPRYHSFNAMLWDWNSTDSHTSQTVSTMVSNDLSTFKNNGFSVLHLYIWDRQIMMDFSSGDVRGFCSAVSDPGPCANSGDQHPEYSPDATGVTGKLWENLNAFLTVADNHDLYVIITFVNGTVRNMLAKSSNCSAIASYYKTWTQRFVDDLLKLSWSACEITRERRWLRLENRRHYVLRRVTGEWRMTGYHFIKNHAETPDIGTLINVLAAGLLGRHVTNGSQYRSEIGLN